MKSDKDKVRDGNWMWFTIGMLLGAALVTLMAISTVDHLNDRVMELELSANPLILN